LLSCSLQAETLELVAAAASSSSSLAVLQTPPPSWLNSLAGARTAHACYQRDGSGSGGGGDSSSGRGSGGAGEGGSGSGGGSTGGRKPRAGFRSKRSRGAAAPSTSLDAPTAQLRSLQASLARRQQPAAAAPGEEGEEEAEQAAQHFREAMQLPEHVARTAMRDPLGVLMASQGVPLGISLKVNTEQVLRQAKAQADR
jgi:hypothetical protein